MLKLKQLQVTLPGLCTGAPPAYVLGSPSVLHKHMNQGIINYYKILINWIDYVITMLACVSALHEENIMQNTGNKNTRNFQSSPAS